MKPNDPSPAEIAQACAEIQRGWSPEERFRRLRADWRPFVLGADRCKSHDMSADAYEQHVDTGGHCGAVAPPAGL